MTILNDIRQALDAQLATTVGIPALAFENAPYDAVAGTPYIRTQFITTSVRPAVRGPSPSKRYQGLYVMTICTPEAKGAGAALDLADSLLARFAGSSDIAGVAATVSIEYSEAQTGYMEPPFYCLPVAVAWYAYAQ